MRVLCPKEMAGDLGVSARTITRLLDSGEIEGFKVGPKLWRSTDLDLEAYMVRRKLAQRKAQEAKKNFAIQTDTASKGQSRSDLPYGSQIAA